MFYNQIRPLTQHLSKKAQESYRSRTIKKEVNRLVKDEIAKIAIRTNNSPYIEDHIEYLAPRVDSADEGAWREAPVEPTDSQASFSLANLKQLNII